MKINLNGKWKFYERNSDNYLDVVVPTCNYLDLIKSGEIKHPFYGTNEKDAFWVSERDWVYERDFVIRENDLHSDKLFLECDMLDTLTDIFINNTKIASTKNCHTGYEFDIKPFCNIGENNIKIIFYSPVNYARKMQKLYHPPFNENGINGISFIRKPQSHFGWDWGPILPPSGIVGDIYIKPCKTARIVDFQIKQNHFKGHVDLNISLCIENYIKKTLVYKISIIQPNGEIIKSQEKIKTEADCIIKITDPELWWTHELNLVTEQPLYKIHVEIFDGNIKVDSKLKNVGLRTIKLDTNRDKYGKNFRFILNGVPIFIKGANWIPSDSFINQTTPEKIEYYIKSCIDCNFNMLRVWGGGYYESNYFYELCDKLGILIWQDFGFACQPYPFFNNDFLQNVKQEIIYNVKRLRHHASLALWCGNNEIEAMRMLWILRRNYIKWNEKFFYNILPDWLKKLDIKTDYIPSSPCGLSHNIGVESDNVGDTHLWAVWHGLQPLNYYRKRYTRFCSEFGFESLPDLKTIKKFASPKDYSLNSKVFKNHQKCRSGNKKIIYYIASRFRLPKKFEDYIYLSQICEQECVKDATEHWRRNKGRCNGAMFWQLNDCWPVVSWSSIDYYGNFKALQYASKHFYSPVAVSVFNNNKNFEIHLLNDSLNRLNVEVGYKIIDFSGNVKIEKQKNVLLNVNSQCIPFTFSIKSLNIKMKDLKKCVLCAWVKKNGKTINYKTHLFDTEKNIKFPQAKLNMQIEIKNNTAIIKLKSDKFMRFVQLFSNCITTPFSDNYFDLLPNEEKIIYQKLNRKFSRDEYKNTLKITNMADVVPKGTKFADFVKCACIFMIPINFFSYLYTRHVPKDKNLNN